MIRDLMEFSTVMAESRVDDESMTLRGVTLMSSRMSENGYEYSHKALDSLVKLADGAKVFLNHQASDEAKNRENVRDIRDFAGVLSNPRRHGDAVYADFHATSKVWPDIKDLVRLQPAKVGFSIHSKAYVEKHNGQESVADIARLVSADIVSSAAMTQSLFESRQPQKETTQEPVKVGSIVAIREHEILVDIGRSQPLYIEKKKLDFIPRVGQEVALVHETTKTVKESRKSVTKKEARPLNDELLKMRMYGIEAEDRDLEESILNAVKSAGHRQESVSCEIFATDDLPDAEPWDGELNEEAILEAVRAKAPGIPHGGGEAAQIDIYRSPEATWTRRIKEQKAPGQQTTKEVSETEDDEILQALVRE